MSRLIGSLGYVICGGFLVILVKVFIAHIMAFSFLMENVK